MWPNPTDPYEPKWLPQDVEDALAWQAELRLRCTGCGHPIDETTALDEHQRPLHDWEARSTVCQACEAIRVDERRFTTNHDASVMDGRRFYALRQEGRS